MYGLQPLLFILLFYYCVVDVAGLFMFVLVDVFCCLCFSACLLFIFCLNCLFLPCPLSDVVSPMMQLEADNSNNHNHSDILQYDETMIALDRFVSIHSYESDVIFVYLVIYFYDFFFIKFGFVCNSG